MANRQGQENEGFLATSAISEKDLVLALILV